MVNTYELPEVDFAKAVDLDIKNYCSKSESANCAMPEIKTSHSEMSTGINSEISSKHIIFISN